MTFRLITLIQPACVQNALIHIFFHLAEQQAMSHAKSSERKKKIGFSIKKKKSHGFQGHLSLQPPMAKSGSEILGTEPSPKQAAAT